MVLTLVVNVLKSCAISSRLRNDDTVQTNHFKLIPTETSSFDFPFRWLE